MESFEIDDIKVSDSLIEITYWISDQKEPQTVIFKTADFENWLSSQRTVSLSAYWDHWMAHDIEQFSDRIVRDDIRSYLNYRVSMFKPSQKKAAMPATARKPMTRVTGSKSSKKGRSA